MTEKSDPPLSLSFNRGGAWLPVMAALVGAFGLPWIVFHTPRQFFHAKASDEIQGAVLLWAMSLAVQGGFWAASMLWLGSSWKRTAARLILSENVDLAWVSDVIIPLVLSLGIVVGGTVITRSEGFPTNDVVGHQLRCLPFVTFAGLGAAGTFGVGMLWTGARLKATCRATTKVSEILPTYLVLRDFLDRCLTGAAMILGLGVIATAALRNAAGFKTQYVIAYGLTYSIALALVYTAGRSAFQVVGRELLEHLTPVPGSAVKGCPDLKEYPELKDWSERRSALVTVLQLELSGVASFGPALATLLPILLLTSQLPGAK